ncbi:MAG: hypothetical protein KatS3mg110_0931 [Pirellulaceae bacterium]|nr:MAG: hypothetical protein KatS3mg110_0002 [Pirellulaceae bacterium]GIW92890.1 MAG: hypothetical protein KatS3mg110_0931 [Pirellulaceae bacterium]
MEAASGFQQVVSQMTRLMRQELFGEAGAPAWGTPFREIEEFCCAIGDMVARELMRQSMAVQAQRVPTGEDVCPECGQSVDTPKDEPFEPHVLDTCRGPVDWNEPKRYCRRCRRAFFPSEPSIGDTSERDDESDAT